MIIVTGASGGLGQGLLKELAGLDALVGTYHSHPPTKSSDVQWMSVDVTEARSVTEFIQAIRPSATRITLINLAGASRPGLSLTLPEGDWDQVVAVNLTGAFLMSRAIVRLMMRERWGRIINVGSVVSRLGLPGSAAYAATKAGLGALTETLAQEYAPFQVTVNCLRLGYFSEGLIHTLSEADRSRALARIALKRLGTPGDLAGAIKYLINADYVTGATLDLDGGLV